MLLASTSDNSTYTFLGIKCHTLLYQRSPDAPSLILKLKLDSLSHYENTYITLSDTCRHMQNWINYTHITAGDKVEGFFVILHRRILLYHKFK